MLESIDVESYMCAIDILSSGSAVHQFGVKARMRGNGEERRSIFGKSILISGL